MRSSTLFAVAAVAVFAGSGLHAQQTAPAGRSSAEVAAEAVAAAHDPDGNGSIGTRGFGYSKFVSSADPAVVRQGAIETASAPAKTGNDYTGGIGSGFKSTRSNEEVAAEARAAAGAPDQNVAAESKYNSAVVSTMAPSTVSAAK